MLIPFLPLLSAVATPARAVFYFGNPVLDFRVDRPADDYVEGTVTVDKVRVYHCGGGYTDYPVADTIDPVVVNHVEIDAGDHCGLTFFWSSDLDIDGDGSLGAFTVRYEEATTAVTLDTDIDPVALAPYSVVSGSMPGGAPWLLTNIE